MDKAHSSQVTYSDRLHNKDFARTHSPAVSLMEGITANLSPVIEGANEFLDRHVLPWPVRFLTHRFVILLTIGLLIPLLLFANNTVLVLGINSYLNVMSVAVSSIVLLYTTIAEVRQRQIAEMQERRAQEDHTHVTEMHSLLLQTLASRNEEIEEIRRTLTEWQGKTYVPSKPTRPVDLRALHPRGYKRFATNELGYRWQKQVLHHPLTSAVGKSLFDWSDGDRGDV